jgi:hypothetical protein
MGSEKYMTKPTIKIIKRDDRSRVRKASAAAAKKQPDPTRKMSETVSGWVRDFKQKSNAEAESLLATFFDETPQPNEA